MQRTLAPKRQVNEISQFVRQCGGIPKHAQVLELVARLNGAQNWNALDGRARPDNEPQRATGTNEPVKAGEREFDPLTSHTLFIGTGMFAEEESWFLMTDGGSGHGNFERTRELTRDELELIQKEGVVVEAMVLYPRSDRYGTPDVAITLGLLEWLHEEQGLSTCPRDRFELYSEDTGDDTPSSCVLTIRLPKRFEI